MKTQKKITGFAILMFAANGVLGQSSNNLAANESFPKKLSVAMKVVPQTKVFMTNVTEEQGLKVKVWFANPDESKVTISIKSQEGGYFFSKRLSDAWYSQTYNFSGVEDGIYTIEIAKGKECFRKNILIATDTYTMRTGRVY
ncbi:MAG: hypothetical protein JWO92_1163 [Chitinophagaceae bacterium]|nr:hypothetical protein [Chitinophagaceae bacterium]